MEPTTTIRDIESLIVDIPSRRAHQHARALMNGQSYVLIRISTDDGLQGIGEVATAGGPWWSGDSVESVKVTLDTYISPLLLGADPSRIASLMTMLDNRLSNNWFVKAGVEMALFDLAGKRAGLPVHDLLGGRVRDALPIVWPLAVNDEKAEIAEAEAKLEQNFARHFKVKVGFKEPARDIARLHNLARHLPADATLRVDINEAWDEVTAQRWLPALEQAGVSLVEQPLSRYNLKGMARLQNSVRIPLMADESLCTLADAMNLSEMAAARVFSLKLMKSGGIRPSLKIASIAEAAGIAVFGGCFLESSIGTCAHLHLGASLPALSHGCEWVGPAWLADDLCTQPVRYEDFQIHIPTGVGLGFELDEDKLKHYRRDK
ncbi:MAG: muconate cycloisomerase family protein [Pseudomonadales bacterium]|nr:muconate cycloisomerase family protein [Pseudomonadales bacterium]